VSSIRTGFTCLPGRMSRSCLGFLALRGNISKVVR